MKGFITACFLVTNTLGNFLNVVWTPRYGGSLVDEAAKRGSLLPGQVFGQGERDPVRLRERILQSMAQ